MERISDATLAPDRGGRLLHDRGLDGHRTPAIHRLFFIELSTRRVEIGGISAVANGLWMNQIARHLTDSVDGLLAGKRYLIHDRDRCSRTNS